MSKIKIAILEDNKLLLKDLKKDFEKTELVEVVACATNSSDFIDKVKAEMPDAIAVDIELPGDSMNGVDVANMLELPTLWVSGNTRDYIDRIVELNLKPAVITEILSKPITDSKINGILPKFVERVLDKKRKRIVPLKILREGIVMIEVDSIVYLTTEGESSGNCVIYFSNRPPGTLINYPLKKVEEWDIEKTFLQISGSVRVNRKCVTQRLPNKLKVYLLNNGGKKDEKWLDISEGFQPAIRKLFR